MNEQEFVTQQIEWLQMQFQRAIDVDSCERIISAIEGIVVTALVEGVFPKFQTDKTE